MANILIIDHDEVISPACAQNEKACSFTGMSAVLKNTSLPIADEIGRGGLPQPCKQMILPFGGFGMFLDYLSVGIERNGHATAFLCEWERSTCQETGSGRSGSGAEGQNGDIYESG